MSVNSPLLNGMNPRQSQAVTTTQGPTIINGWCRKWEDTGVDSSRGLFN